MRFLRIFRFVFVYSRTGRDIVGAKFFRNGISGGGDGFGVHVNAVRPHVGY